MSTPVTICRKVFTDKIGEKALCSIIDRTVIIPEGITEIGKKPKHLYQTEFCILKVMKI